MAYLNTTHAASSPLSAIGSLVNKFSAGLARRKVYAQTLRELRELSDRELNDLGLSRGSITSVAREAAYGM